MRFDRIQNPSYDFSYADDDVFLEVPDRILSDVMRHISRTVFEVGFWHPPGETKVDPCYDLALRLAEDHWDDNVYVVIYDSGKAFGGPEEGGWNFTAYSKKEAHLVPNIYGWNNTLAAAEIIAEQHRKAAKYDYKDRYGRFETQTHVEIEIVDQSDSPGKLERQPRPHYC